MDSGVFETVWAIWRRRRWLAIATFLVPFTAGASFVAFMPDIYQSTATLLVERQQVPEALVRPTVTGEFEIRLRTISQEILSRSRLEALIERFDLYPDLRRTRPAEAVVERMRSDIALDVKGSDPRRGSTIAFAISYRGRAPKTVAEVTNTLASFYIEENLRIRGRQASGIVQFLRNELEETRKRLDEQERRVSEFKRRHVGELPQQMQSNLATLESLNAQLRLNSVTKLRLEEKRDLLSLQLETGPAAAGAAAPAPDGHRRLALLQQQLEELTSRFTDSHPAVVRKRAEIAAVQERMAREPVRTSSSPDSAATVPLTPHALRIRQALAEIDAELKVLEDEDRRLRSAVALYEQRVARTPQREQEFLELSRDYEAARELYQSLAKRYDEAQLAESMEQHHKGEQFRILDPALVSAVPAAPRRSRLLAVVFVLSAGLAMGVVVLAEQLDTSFHTLGELRGFTTVPVIASIPRILVEADMRRRRWRMRLASTGTAAALALVVVVAYLLAHENEALVRW